MAVTAELLAVLACPSADHAPLRLEGTGSDAQLVCTYCASRFQISDGIPVLLPDEAIEGPNGLGIRADEGTAGDTGTAGDAGTAADAERSPYG